MDNMPRGDTSVASSRIDPDEDWGASDFDVRHTFGGGLTYVIPRGIVAVWRAITGGWSVHAVFTARSAPPINVVIGTTVFGVSNALRPDIVPNMPLYMDDAAVPGGRRFNRAAFAAPPLDARGKRSVRAHWTQCASRFRHEPARPRRPPRYPVQAA